MLGLALGSAGLRLTLELAGWGLVAEFPSAARLALNYGGGWRGLGFWQDEKGSIPHKGDLRHDSGT